MRALRFMRFASSPLDRALLLLLLFSLITMFLANEHPFARDWFCHAGFCLYSSSAAGWNKIFYDIAVGYVVSAVFYVLVVRIQEELKRERITRSLRVQYLAFKRDCVRTILGVADGSYTLNLADELIDLAKFREYFQQDVSPDQNRWHRFANNLTAESILELVTTMEIFRQEIAFVMNNIDIDNEKAFEFFKRLSSAIFWMRNSTPDYDSTKSFCGFFWNLFGGWDFITGYRERDIVEEMIGAI